MEAESSGDPAKAHQAVASRHENLDRAPLGHGDLDVGRVGDAYEGTWGAQRGSGTTGLGLPPKSEHRPTACRTWQGHDDLQRWPLIRVKPRLHSIVGSGLPLLTGVLHGRVPANFSGCLRPQHLRCARPFSRAPRCYDHAKWGLCGAELPKSLSQAQEESSPAEPLFAQPRLGPGDR